MTRKKTLFMDWILFLLQPVGWSRKLFLAHGVVRGMDYLHSVQPHPVIHGDLKIDNILVGDGLIAKVSALLTVYFIAVIFLFRNRCKQRVSSVSEKFIVNGISIGLWGPVECYLAEIIVLRHTV